MSIYRHKAHNGQFFANEGTEYKWGCCPKCQEPIEKVSIMSKMDMVGLVKCEAKSLTMTVWYCNCCENYFLYNTVKNQMVDACKIHWNPIKINRCLVCMEEEYKQMESEGYMFGYC